MPARKKYSDEEKQRVLALADAVGASEASRLTGVPTGTILSWRHLMRKAAGIPTETKHKEAAELKESIETAKQKGLELAARQIGDYIAERVKNLADELYDLAASALREAKHILENTKEKDKSVARARWLHSVIGAMHYGIQNAQLLAGKPTVRTEETKRHEYEIIQRIVDDPESVELAERLLQRAANQFESGDTGPFGLDGERGALEAVSPPPAAEQETC